MFMSVSPFTHLLPDTIIIYYYAKDTTCSKGYITTKTDKGTREFKVFLTFTIKSSLHMLDVIIIQAKDCGLDTD